MAQLFINFPCSRAVLQKLASYARSCQKEQSITAFLQIKINAYACTVIVMILKPLKVFEAIN